MNDRLREILCREIVIKSDLALIAAEDLKDAAIKMHEAQMEFFKNGFLDFDPQRKWSEHSFHQRRIWYSVHNLLSHAGSISRILWPPWAKYEQRGTEMRKNLGIDDAHSFSDRDMRDAFEHFDDRVEEWEKESGTLNFSDLNIGPLGAVTMPSSRDILRHYDPYRRWICFRGKIYQLDDVVRSIQEFKGAALKILEIDRAK